MASALEKALQGGRKPLVLYIPMLALPMPRLQRGAKKKQQLCDLSGRQKQPSAMLPTVKGWSSSSEVHTRGRLAWMFQAEAHRARSARARMHTVTAGRRGEKAEKLAVEGERGMEGAV